jgi:hypothetical protein
VVWEPGVHVSARVRAVAQRRQPSRGTSVVYIDRLCAGKRWLLHRSDNGDKRPAALCDRKAPHIRRVRALAHRGSMSSVTVKQRGHVWGRARPKAHQESMTSATVQQGGRVWGRVRPKAHRESMSSVTDKQRGHVWGRVRPKAHRESMSSVAVKQRGLVWGRMRSLPHRESMPSWMVTERRVLCREGQGQRRTRSPCQASRSP